MAGQHTEVALDTGDIDLIDFSGEGEFFRRNEIEVNSEWLGKQRRQEV
jgi:hypothetical protein